MTMQREYQIFCETLSSKLSMDPTECACGGSGWVSSPFDTWHKCRVHWDQHPHPEYDEEVSFYYSFESHEAYKEYLASLPKDPIPMTDPVNLSPITSSRINDDEDIPF